MKYFADIVSDILINKKIIQIDREGFNQQQRWNDDEILKYHVEDEIDGNHEYIYRFAGRECDFIGNVRVNGHSNFRFRYSQADKWIDYQPDMYLSLCYGVSALLIEMSSYGVAKLEYDGYLVKDRNDLLYPPYIIANIDGKLLTFVDDPGYHCDCSIGLFNSLDDINSYYERLYERSLIKN